ncbi:hypothetical protein LSH36_74g00028 [Paralvinella palmiformis]|uniref:Nuclear pore complex protein n=1 Tax=Paralvinella palmiformis TaxID=53620 RepID=A0AAD9K2K7_9ANNE|nr:hypothetical protein LSH36_74g00028 [Paralvinella palmiformis]
MEKLTLTPKRYLKLFYLCVICLAKGYQILKWGPLPSMRRADTMDLDIPTKSLFRTRDHSRSSDQKQFLSMDSPVLRERNISRTMKRQSLGVQKSLQILDEAVGTPGYALHASRTPASLRRSTYTPVRMSTDDTIQVSDLFGPSIISLLATPRPNNQSKMEEDTTTINLALEEDPTVTNCTELFTDFSETLTANGELHEVFHLVGEYESLCKENTEKLKKIMQATVPGQSKFVKLVNMVKLLQQEGNIWSLIASLYKDRLETDSRMCPDEDVDDELMMIDNMGKYQSEQDLMKAYYEKDATVRQSQLVIDWLEKTARDQLELYHKVEFFSDEMGAWENTLHALKQKKCGLLSMSDRPMVDELDPDAPIRQGKPLADLDQEDEHRLIKHMFAYVRSGQLEKAKELCVKVGQAWRAATLDGWRLYHDPNYESLGPNGCVQKPTGNPFRCLWKATCWKMSEEKRYCSYERALYAAFCGNLKQLLPICLTSDDYLWAYFRVMVDQLTEQHLQLTYVNKRKCFVDMPSDYWDKLLTVEKIFNDIKACSNQNVQQDLKSYFSTIEKYIILGDSDHLIEEMYDWCKEDMDQLAPHALRFMAHLVLFFRSIGVSNKEELSVSVLEAYVKYLIEDKHTHLVATYVALLPKEMQVEWYAKFLEGITDTDQRKSCLTLALKAGLDVPSITKLVVENIRSRDSADFSGDADAPLDVTTTKEDQLKIDAIDWLVFNPLQRAEALKQANALMRNFLASRKLTAARAVFDKIPPDSVDVIVQASQSQTHTVELQPEDDNAIKEYLCHQAYLDAHDSFCDWFEHYHNAKPTKPNIPKGASFTERVAFEHKERQYEMDLARWKHNLMMQTKVTCDRLYNVLLFVNGGWMVDQRQDGTRDDNRTHQMRLLRQLCLPGLCFLLHTVLHNTEQYKKCVQLANLVASDQHQLYKTFRKDELQQLLHKIRETSVALLDSGLDPLGYPLIE